MSDPLEALLVLASIYVTLSIAGSALIEVLFGALDVRAKVLKSVIQKALPQSHKALFRLPTIMSLSPRGEPAYIDARTFAGAVRFLDRERNTSTGEQTERPELTELRELRVGSELQTDLLTQWYDLAMTVATSRYRLRVQAALFVVGLLTSVAAGLDSISYLRAGLMPDATAPVGPAAFATAVLGHVMTASAVALGAQYWFDLARNVLALRAGAQEQGVRWGRPAKRP